MKNIVLKISTIATTAIILVIIAIMIGSHFFEYSRYFSFAFTHYISWANIILPISSVVILSLWLRACRNQIPQKLGVYKKFSFSIKIFFILAGILYLLSLNNSLYGYFNIVILLIYIIALIVMVLGISFYVKTYTLNLKNKAFLSLSLLNLIISFLITFIFSISIFSISARNITKPYIQAGGEICYNDFYAKHHPEDCWPTVGI